MKGDKVQNVAAITRIHPSFRFSFVMTAFSKRGLMRGQEFFWGAVVSANKQHRRF
jgi:hypothetical protein